jgi:hypothetical protein
MGFDEPVFCWWKKCNTSRHAEHERTSQPGHSAISRILGSGGAQLPYQGVMGDSGGRSQDGGQRGKLGGG